MTHEGRMARGEEKFSKGIQDIETEYFLKHKGGANMSEEDKPVETPANPEETKEEEDGKSN